VFKDPEPGNEEAEAAVEEEELEEGEESKKPEKEKAEVLPHRIVVSEVVREKRMHYFTVPRLGSFMAIRLEYDSCLTESAFDAGVADMESVIQR
jgi:hypothetical protein